MMTASMGTKVDDTMLVAKVTAALVDAKDMFVAQPTPAQGRKRRSEVRCRDRDRLLRSAAASWFCAGREACRALGLRVQPMSATNVVRRMQCRM